VVRYRIEPIASPSEQQEAPVADAPTETFEQFAKRERERLRTERDDLAKQQRDLEKRIDQIDNEIAAIEAYEAARAGKHVSIETGTRRSSKRQDILDVLAKHPQGLTRSGIIEALDAPDDKKTQQSVSNALSNLKRAGKVRLDGGNYTAV
jgi:DNA-binding transcriptional ArsR family regulator